MSQDVTANATAELLECLDILMEESDSRAAEREWEEMRDAFFEHYQQVGGAYVAGDPAFDECVAQQEVLYTFRPPEPVDSFELETALWQTASLTMTLLMDHMALLDTVRELSDEQEERDAVSQIIKPKLYLP